MRTLLLIALTACGALAVPVPEGGSEVDLVQPRRVFTGSRAGPSYAGAFAGSYPRLNTNDIFRQMFGSGFLRPVARPRVDPNCDSGKFQLSDAEYDMVMDCQRERSEEQDLKQCILDGLPDDSNEMRAFLDRDDFSIAGISFSFSIAILDGQSTQKRSVTFRLCPPSDEENTVEEEDQPQEAQPPARRPALPGGAFTFGTRPTFQMPDFFSQPDSFFDFDAFKPIFNIKPVQFPAFPNFDFDITDTSYSGFDPETCVKQTFQLPKEQFDQAKSCQFRLENFKECLTEKLGDNEEAKEMLEFAGAEGMVVVDRRFYSSVSSVNGEVTRKNKIQLTHCEEAELEEPAAEDPAGEEAVQGSPDEQEQQQQQQQEEVAPEETPQQTSEQETYPGENFEP